MARFKSILPAASCLILFLVAVAWAIRPQPIIRHRRGTHVFSRIEADSYGNISSTEILVTDSPYNAQCDGTTDDHDAIESAITAACSSNTYGGIAIPAATCVVASPLTTGCSNLVIRGSGPSSVLKFTKALTTCLNEGTDTLFKLTGALSNLVFRDFKITTNVVANDIVDANGNCRGHSAFYLSGSSDILIENLDVEKLAGRAIVIDDSVRVTVRDNYVHDGWSDGILLKGVRDALVSGNRLVNLFVKDSNGDGCFDSQFADGIDVGAATNVASQHLLIVDNLIDGATRNGIVIEGTVAYSTTDVVIESNVIKNVGIGCSDSIECGAGIWVENSDESIVLGDNRISSSRAGYVIMNDFEWRCSGGANDGQVCQYDSDCSGGTCPSTSGKHLTATISGGAVRFDGLNLPACQPASQSSAIWTRGTATLVNGLDVFFATSWRCSGGTNDGQACVDSSECPSGTCLGPRSVYVCDACRDFVIQGGSHRISDMPRVFEIWSSINLAAAPKPSIQFLNNSFETLALHTGQRFLKYGSTGLGELRLFALRGNIFRNIVSDVTSGNALLDFTTLDSVDHLEVADNVFDSDASDFTLLNTSKATDIRIIGNSFHFPGTTSASGAVIRVEGALNRYVIADNYFDAQAQQKIWVDSSNAIGSILDNWFIGNSVSAQVRLYSASNTVVSGNHSRDSSGGFIWMGTGTSNTLVTDNEVAESTLVALDSGTNNHYYSNVVGTTWTPGDMITPATGVMADCPVGTRPRYEADDSLTTCIANSSNGVNVFLPETGAHYNEHVLSLTGALCGDSPIVEETTSSALPSTSQPSALVAGDTLVLWAIQDSSAPGVIRFLSPLSSLDVNDTLSFKVCAGGSQVGLPCVVDSDCPSSTCVIDTTNWGSVRDMVYSATNDRFYALFQNNTRTTVAEVNHNVTPMTWIRAIYGDVAISAGSMAIDSTYLYTVSFVNRKVAKWALSGLLSPSSPVTTPDASVTLDSSLEFPKAMEESSGFLFIAGTSSTTNGWIAKVNTSSMTVTASRFMPLSSDMSPADDFAVLQDHVFLPFDQNNGDLVVLDTTNFTTETPIRVQMSDRNYSGDSGSCFAARADWGRGDVWVVCNGTASENDLWRVDGYTFDVDRLSMSVTDPSEIVVDETNEKVYVANYASPFKLVRVDKRGALTCRVSPVLVKDISIDTPTTADSDLYQLKFPVGASISRLSCSTDTGTVHIQFDERLESTPNTPGINIMAGDDTCNSTNGGVYSSFSNPTISPNSPLNLQIRSVTGSPNDLRIHLEYRNLN